MHDEMSFFYFLGLLVIGAPLALCCVLGTALLIDRKLSEAATGALCLSTIAVGLLAVLAVLAAMWYRGTPHVSVELGEWVLIPGYHFSVMLIFDWLSIPFAIASFVLCGTVAAFASRYMHREGGYHRFFLLYSLFLLGIVAASLAGTIETLFAGWELVGLSSVLLIAYFHERPATVRNGMWVWVVYRVSDASLVLATIVMHRYQGKGDFDQLLGGGAWPEAQAAMTSGAIVTVGMLLVIAAAGKSALVPFSGWLPRAMEGPTPSSAIFYGALSVHLGAYLLLRVSSLLEQSAWLTGAVVVLGVATALYAYLAAGVQTDIKSALALASLAQVGLIVAEIGLGLHVIALVHLLGNACLRTLQFIRAPSLLHDYHLLESAIGEPLPRGNRSSLRIGHPYRAWLYRFLLHRGYLDALLDGYVVAPVLSVFRFCDAAERRWTEWIAGAPYDAQPGPSFQSVEDLP